MNDNKKLSLLLGVEEQEFDRDPRLVLREMMKKEDYFRFAFSLYNNLEWPAESEYQQILMQRSILIDYILDTTGKLRDAAIEFIEKGKG